MHGTYIKDFDAWNEKKKALNEAEPPPIFKERDIWWCSLGINVGSEEDGKHENFERPAVIFRIFDDSTLWVIPLTTKSWPKESRIHYTFTCNGMTRAVKINQLRTISSKRLLRYSDQMPYDDFQSVRKYVIGLA